jgi:hypothetical protein
MPKLGFEIRFSTWHIKVGCLRTAHVQMTSLRAANLRGLVLTTNCHIPTLSHFSKTPSMRNRQFAVPQSRVLAVHRKTASRLLQAMKI